jgi:hypothetical protein
MAKAGADSNNSQVPIGYVNGLSWMPAALTKQHHGRSWLSTDRRLSPSHPISRAYSVTIGHVCLQHAISLACCPVVIMLLGAIFQAIGCHRAQESWPPCVQLRVVLAAKR